MNKPTRLPIPERRCDILTSRRLVATKLIRVLQLRNCLIFTEN